VPEGPPGTLHRLSGRDLMGPRGNVSWSFVCLQILHKSRGLISAQYLHWHKRVRSEPSAGMMTVTEVDVDWQGGEPRGHTGSRSVRYSLLL
jgi:hypothetical protein